ncbi:hypothetical protein [Rhizobium rhizophilum]|nr:hypothetical protein [Rhizobium rhizophilum]
MAAAVHARNSLAADLSTKPDGFACQGAMDWKGHGPQAGDGQMPEG